MNNDKRRHTRKSVLHTVSPRATQTAAVGKMSSSVQEMTEALTVMGDSAAATVKYAAETVEAVKKVKRAAQPITDEIGAVVNPVIRRAGKTIQAMTSGAGKLARTASRKVKGVMAMASHAKPSSIPNHRTRKGAVHHA